MDFQSALDHLVSIPFSPRYKSLISSGRLNSIRIVYKATILRKQIKNQWARDDPAFAVILLGMMLVSSIAFAAAFAVSVVHFFRLILFSIVCDFVVAGLGMSTLYWFVANTFLRMNRAMTSIQFVEWLYAFDVHCYSFVPFYLILYVLQYFLLPLLLSQSLFSTVMSNILYLSAFSAYQYVTFLGFECLPFLQRTQAFLSPILLYVVIFFFACLLNINLSRNVLSFYFGERV
jgi:hypothetical protein